MAWAARLFFAALAASFLGAIYTIAIADRALLAQFLVGFAWTAIHLATLSWTLRYPRRRRRLAILLTAFATALGSTLAILVLERS